MTTQIAVRLPDHLVERMDELVSDGHQTRSSFVRAAIEHQVSQVLNQRDAAIYDRQPLSEIEMGLADDPKSWEATPQW